MKLWSIRRFIGPRSLKLDVFSQQVLRSALALLFIASLLATSTFAAAPPIFSTAARNFAQDVQFAFFRNSFGSDNWFDRLQHFLRTTRAAADDNTVVDQTRNVARIEIYPRSIKLRQGEKIAFTAVAFDVENKALGNVAFEWKRRNLLEDASETPLFDQLFEAEGAGNFEVTVEANNVQARVTITVEAAPLAERLAAAATPAKSVFSSSRDDNKAVQKTGPSHKEETAENDPTRSLLSSGRWTDENWNTADNFSSQVGAPPGGPSDGGAHSGNFQIDAPLLSLPGRAGLDLNLSLHYNARLWHRSGSEITYDIDRGYPAPGWTLGYGKMTHTGSATGRCILIGADGTRHSFEGNTAAGAGAQWSSSFVGHTTDNTFIDYSCGANSSGAAWGQAKLPDGTIIDYGAPSGYELFPTRITDRHGNFLTISYLENQGPRIQTVVDTIGRSVRFGYVNGRLYYINTLGVGGVERTLVWLHTTGNPCHPQCGGPCEPVNQPPVARPGGPYSGEAGAAITFNGTASTDPDGGIGEYYWTFGDGAAAYGAIVSHAYAAAGTYTVSLRVTDDLGAQRTATTTASIAAAPPPPPTPTPTPVPAATGTISAAPNPIQVCDGSGYGVTTINWTSSNTSEVQVRVGAPDGALFAASGPGAASSTTGKWVSNGAVFYLQNTSGGAALTAANTLATVTVAVTSTGCSAPPPAKGSDGLLNLTYDAATNRITTAGYEYDASGNLVKGASPDGQRWLRYEYDAAGRLIWQRDALTGNYLQSSLYGASNRRLYKNDGAAFTFYLWSGEQVAAEFTTIADWGATTAAVNWSKSYVYLGDRLLSTVSSNSAGGQSTEYNHADRLGTRLVTNATSGTAYEQATMPFGSMLMSESTWGEQSSVHQI